MICSYSEPRNQFPKGTGASADSRPLVEPNSQDPLHAVAPLAVAESPKDGDSTSPENLPHEPCTSPEVSSRREPSPRPATDGPLTATPETVAEPKIIDLTSSEGLPHEPTAVPKASISNVPGPRFAPDRSPSAAPGTVAAPKVVRMPPHLMLQKIDPQLPSETFEQEGTQDPYATETLHHVLGRLPSQILCDQLFARFLVAVYPVIPVCYVPRLKSQYAIFSGKDHNKITPGLLSLIVAVLFTGAATSGDIDSTCWAMIKQLYSDKYDGKVCSYQGQSDGIMCLQGLITMHTFRTAA